MSIYEKSKPYFLLRGRVNVPETDDFQYLETLLEQTGIPHKEFLTAVFTRTWGEEHYPIVITPKSLTTKWAFRKYADWKQSPDPIDMEISFINRTKIMHIDFRDHGMITPMLLNTIRKRDIALSYLVTAPSFWAMYDRLDKDIQQEFFNVKGIYYLKDMVFRTPKILGATTNE